MDFRKTEFIKSAVSPKDFIRDGRAQIVFAGRSNVGKSSVINALTMRKSIARVGNRPGKTSQINYFLVDNRAYIVDLPGYGYAKVSKAERDRWGKLLESYFAETGLAAAGVLIVDARHKPTDDDIVMASWFADAGCPFAVAANKTDKTRKSELDDNIALIKETLKLGGDTAVIRFSAETKTGRDNLISEIEKMLVV